MVEIDTRLEEQIIVDLFLETGVEEPDGRVTTRVLECISIVRLFTALFELLELVAIHGAGKLNVRLGITQFRFKGRPIIKDKAVLEAHLVGLKLVPMPPIVIGFAMRPGDRVIVVFVDLAAVTEMEVLAVVVPKAQSEAIDLLVKDGFGDNLHSTTGRTSSVEGAWALHDFDTLNVLGIDKVKT